MSVADSSKINDEIDIFEFCSRIWAAFKNFLISIKDIITTIFIYLIRKSLWIITFGLAGILTGFLLYSIFPKVYIASLEVDTGGVDNSVVINHINKLYKPNNKLSNRPDSLANYLNLSREQIDAIHNIKAYYGIDVNKDGKQDYIDFAEKYNPKDTNQVRIPSFVHVKVSVYDDSVLPALRNGLIQYVNKNAYLQRLFETDRDQKEQLLKGLESLDTLLKAQLSKDLMSDRGQVLILGNRPENQSFYKDILSLYEEKQKIEKSIRLNTEIILVIQEFSQLQHEEKTVFDMMTKYGIVMAIMGLFCAFLWQYRIIIWKLIREDSTKR